MMTLNRETGWGIIVLFVIAVTVCASLANAQELAGLVTPNDGASYQWKLFKEQLREAFTFNKAKLLELKTQHLEARRLEVTAMDRLKNTKLAEKARLRLQEKSEEIKILSDDPSSLTPQNVRSLQAVLEKLESRENKGNAVTAINKVLEREKGKEVKIVVKPEVVKVNEEITVSGISNRPGISCQAEYDIGQGWVKAQNVRFNEDGRVEMKFYSPIPVQAIGRARCGSVYSNEVKVRIE